MIDTWLVDIVVVRQLRLTMRVHNLTGVFIASDARPEDQEFALLTHESDLAIARFVVFRVDVRWNTGLTPKTGSVSFGLLAANYKFNSWQCVTGKIMERESGFGSSVNPVWLDDGGGL